MENLIQVLKLDGTLFVQFLVFLAAFVALNRLVFTPYMEAFARRHEATAGTRDEAERIRVETKDIHFHYETRAREVRSRIKVLFDQSRKDALKLQEGLVHEARETSAALIRENRAELGRAVANTREELKGRIPALGRSIADKLLGKVSL